VRAAAPVVEELGQTGGYASSGVPLNVVVVSPRQYAAVLADTPTAVFPAAALARIGTGRGPVPVLASPDAVAPVRAAAGLVTIGTQTVRVRIAGQIAGTPAATPGSPFLVLPSWAAGARPLPPTLILLAGSGIKQRQLSAAVARTAPGAEVTVYSAELAELQAAPLPRATVQIYIAGTVAAVVFCVLIVLMSVILDARARELADARMYSMGLSGSQASRASAVEAIPYTVAAAAGGAVAATVLAALLNPVLDLSGLTESPRRAHLQSGIVIVVLTVTGLVVLATVTMLGQRAAARRRTVGEALRVSQ
jgi:putative ABC transport system permease protein